jgi:hypothetical protein
MNRPDIHTEPPADPCTQEEGDDEHSVQRTASLAALAFLAAVSIAAAVIVGLQHARTAVDDCAVQEGGVCVALSGR